MTKYILLIALFLYSCGGTTGHIKFYNFSSSKYEVEKELLKIINNDSAYVVPEKWQSHIEGDYFERIYIYFSSNPEELYQIGFTGDSTEWHQSSTSRLGLISIYQGNQFQYEANLSRKEQERVQERFEKEILSKISFSYYKSD